MLFADRDGLAAVRDPQALVEGSTRGVSRGSVTCGFREDREDRPTPISNPLTPLSPPLTCTSWEEREDGEDSLPSRTRARQRAHADALAREISGQYGNPRDPLHPLTDPPCEPASEAAPAEALEALAELVPTTHEPDGWRGPAVCQIVGISYRQLDYWARTDLVRPSIAEARGSGTKRRYSWDDLIALEVVKRLIAAGVSLQSIRRCTFDLRALDFADVDGAVLVLTQSTCRTARTPVELVDAVHESGSTVHCVPLGQVADHIEARIAGLAPRRLPAEIAHPGGSIERDGER